LIDAGRTPVGEDFAGEPGPDQRPRDRAVGVGSKEALVETGRKSSEQLPLADRPIRGAAEQIVPEIAKISAEVMRPVSKSFDDVNRFRRGQDAGQPQQKPLANPVTRFQLG
jgi:hypothetical protein